MDPPPPSLTRAHWLPWAPALGALGGLVQALPSRGAATCCCTPWVALASVLAVVLIVRRAGARMEPTEGALVGLLTGAVAGLVGGSIAAVRDALFAQGGLVRALLAGGRVTPLDLAQVVWAGALTFFAYLALSPMLGTLAGATAAALAKPTATPPPQ